MNQEQKPAIITSLSPPQATEVREKPEIEDPIYWQGLSDNYYDPLLTPTYAEDLRDYEQSQIPMDIQNSMHIHNCRYVMQDGEYKRLELNQPVHIVRTEKGCRITKIS